MKKYTSLFSLVALALVAFVSVRTHLGMEIIKFNKRGILFNTDTKIPLRDRMDLAWQQEFELTKDPALGEVPKERLLLAWKYQQSLFAKQGLGKAAIPNVSWTERGPNNWGGRTRCVMVDGNDVTGKTLWAGSVGGGLWKTTDITQTSPNWVPINDLFQNIAITHIDQAPANKQIMYFCTGEGNGNLDAVRGLGVWKSTNGGGSWAQLSATNNSSYYYCQKVVSLGNGDTVFVLTRTGLYRSVNGGTAFSKVLGNGTSGALGDIAYDLEVMSNGTIYVTMSSGGATGGTIHKSYNRGSTWSTPLSTPSYVNCDEMEIAVSGTDTNTIYALVESSSKIQAILKSSNAGSSFDTTAKHPVDADNGVSIPSAIKDFSRGQAWYDLSLAVDPNNPNVVVVGGVDLFKTSNGGGTWTQLSHWYGGFGYQEVHADQHYVCFAPGSSSVAYFSNDGGVYRCADLTLSSPVIEHKGNNYNTIQFYACDIHPNAGSNQYVAGAQDNGSHAFSSAGLGSTVEATGGDGAFCHIDQDQPQYWFTSYVYTSYYRSTNTGASFSNVLNTSQNIGSFISPSDYDDAANIMYLAGNNGFFTRWTNPQTGSSIAFDTVAVFNTGKVTHVKVSPNVSNRVYFGLNNGRIVRVDNAHIQAGIDSCINNGKGMPTGSVSCIEVESGNDSHIIATYSNYGVASVWETWNNGFTWTNIEANLPDMPIRWALFNPNKNYQVMLATELGVWTTDSVKGAATVWAPSNSGFANVRTDMLKMRAFDKQVIAATHGRGLYSSNVFAPPFADFVANKTVGYISSFINFTSTSNGATSYLWDFGDGTTSTLQNPSKQYFTAGYYTVTLTINGGMYSKTINSYIQVLPYRPVPYTLAAGGNFDSNPGDFGPETVSGIGFTRGSSTTTGKNGTASGSFAWVTGLTGNYADNNEAYLYTPSFNCTASGTYTLRFMVKNRFEIGYDGYTVQYSLNLGNTWNQLGPAVQTSWYDFANTGTGTAFTTGVPFFNATNSAYTQKSYIFSALAGNSKVSFRFCFKSDGGVNDIGMALDNFEILGPTNSSLPVKLMQFSGYRLPNTQVQLNWQTASEKNNKGFEIERSDDGFTYIKIGFVEGSLNSSTTRSYAFTDVNAKQDQLYYRLKQIDVNGNFEYSKVIRVDALPSEEKIASFSYVGNFTGIKIEAKTAGVKVRLLNQNGQLMQSYTLQNLSEEIDLLELSKGIYLLEFTDGAGNRQVEKLLWL